MSQEDFVETLSEIFEHSPWIPERSWEARPFNDVDSLHAAMLKVLDAAKPEEKLGLICAHPELAGKEAAAGTLTNASTSEQRGAGLDQCTKHELMLLRNLNAAYREKYGFPFVIAVKGLSRVQIMESLGDRLKSERDVEFQACLREIGKIGRFRLDALFS